MAEPDFQRLHADAKNLEAEGDRLLAAYSDLVQNPQDTAGYEAQIDDNLSRRTELVRELYKVSYEPTATQTMLHQAQRHSTILEDHKKTSKRLRSAISQERSRRTLLSSVREDIQSHRSGMARSGTATPAEQDVDAERYYSSEAGRINGSHSIADSLLASAYETRAELMRQQGVLSDVQKRMWKVMSRVPGVNSLISKINTRQKRNSLILSLVIVFCVLFIVFVR